MCSLVVVNTVQAGEGSAAAGWLYSIRTAQSGGVQLPGGATSLRETHGDWIVTCGVTAQAKVCTVSQQQNDSRSGQRVFVIEVNPRTQEGVKATLALPFGLQLDKGVILQVDEAAASAPLNFKTCLPQGCIVETTVNRQTLDSWRKGNNLKLKTVAADNGREILFTVPLKGFSPAMDRAATLMK